MRVTFIQADSYCPGTYIKLKTKKKTVISQRIISESKVPQRALNQELWKKIDERREI